MNNNQSNRNSIAEILNAILILQHNACPDNCLDSCDRPVLGGGTNCLICNTRPIELYMCGSNGVPFQMPTTKDPSEETTTSTVFRVEKVDNNCCTFRVLIPNPDTTSLNPYLGTNSYFTVDLGCLCAIRCLSDTYIECV